jgi:WD40 repeat protein
MRTDASGGVAGVCIFPDGSECDEWAYFRGECKPGDSLAATQPAILPETDSPSPEPQPGLLRVVYFSDGYVTSWTEGAGSVPLAEASTELMRISDDGQVIAFLGTDPQGTFGIFAVDADGSNLRLLVEQDYLQAIQPAAQVVSMDFAPASQMLYFVTDLYDLHRVHAAGGESPAQVFGPGSGGFISFSPDGQWMTMYHPNELVLAHPDGTGARVAFEYPADFVYTMMSPQVTWEQDASAFRIDSATGSQITIWRVPVTSDPVKLMSYAGPYGANLSPDGLKVVYLYFQHDPIDVHLVDLNGQDTTYGSYSSTEYVNLNFMGWRPNSQSFLLNMSDDGRLSSPWLCTPGGQPVKLTDTKYAYAVNWVDAERFIFISEVELRLQRVGEPSIFIDTIHSSGYDYTIINP